MYAVFRVDHIPHNADDLKRWIRKSEGLLFHAWQPYQTPDGVAIRAVTPDKRLVYDGEPLPAAHVPIRQEASIQEQDAKRRRISGVHLMHHYRPRVPYRIAVHLDGEPPITERVHPGVQAHRHDPRDRRDTGQQFLEKRVAPDCVGVVLLGKRDSHGKKPFRPEAKFDRHLSENRADHQACSHQQNKGKRYLGHHEAVAQARPASSADASARVLQRVGQVTGTRVEGRSQPEEK